jgi:solute carrier family 34 (sodium-dependent phosphate cotransporter)
MAHPNRPGPTEGEPVGIVPGLSVAPVDPSASEVAAPRVALIPGWLIKIVFMLAGLFVFIMALELMKSGARVYGSLIINDVLNISNVANSLGLGWLMAYIFLSGSPVAAVAISLFASGTIDGLQAFTMITGSRLGASFIVLFVGFIYYLRGHRRGASISIGVLALLTTAAIYLPALFLGYWMLSSGALGTLQVSATTPVASFIDVIFDPITDFLKSVLPQWSLLLCGIGSLLLAFNLLDRALPEMSAERSAFQRIGRLVYRPAAMFILGCAVTSVTLSVSVSLSILVPLSAKGLVRRENTLPYIMGANITTFIDTLIAALITGGPAAFMIVLVEMLSVAILSLIVLALFYRSFERAILRLQELIIYNNRTLGAFLCIMLITPVILLLVK